MISAQQKTDAAKKLDKVVFLDRDGVINLDSSEYIKSWSEFKFIPRSIEAIKEITLKGFNAIIITNQSVINRNLVSAEGLEYILNMMKNEIKVGGGLIRDIFFCPHIPEDNCQCRKPKPGLIFQAQKAYRIVLKDAVMVGDSAKDIECARNAGCGTAVLVKTGNGAEAEKTLAEKKIYPDHIAKDLYEAVQWIVKIKVG
ncbi:MAG: D-glycero-beta-D-manno-heptose-1,7-bisphosphate 7-phosphatase [Candidatus Aenigmatarchaeota archaeon]|nr:MAG: D-glycero-beta-D-manno-heptose-1,7-bisphosphate 7-phosphatase [Candidatus Aenigmarchaeota archaeon]